MDKKPLYKEILNALKSGNKYKIVFIGDSITSAEWVHPNWRDTVEYILKFSFDEFKDDDWWIPEWNLKFFNYSLDGASTKEFEGQVLTSEKEVNPELYIIMGTFNDIELGISLKEHIQNYSKIFKSLKNKSIIFSPDIYTKDERLNKTYSKYIENLLRTIPEGIEVINGFEIFKKYPIQNFYTLDLNEKYDGNFNESKDPIHPNVLGNIYIAKMILEEGFGIDVIPEKFLEDLRSDTVKYPKWKF